VAAGLSIVDHHPLEIAGRTILLDGYDPARNVGYEYITTEAGDREEITPEVIAELEERMSHGELFLLLVDEGEVSDEAALSRAADHFLRVLGMRGILRGAT
jgi:hypothetical protein